LRETFIINSSCRLLRCYNCCYNSHRPKQHYRSADKSLARPGRKQARGVPRNFVRGGGSINSVEERGQRERGSGGGSPLVRGSRGSCNLVQEISSHIVLINFWYFKIIYDDNQFICHC